MRTALLTPWVVALASLTTPAHADVILRTDGDLVEDVTIVEENLAQVVYKKGNDVRTIASEKVLEITFDKLPRLLDEAQALLAEDDTPGALEQFDLYVEGQIANPGKERRKWAPAWAAWRAVELRNELADRAGTVAAADRLIRHYPESRYLPGAYLAKAMAQQLLDKHSAAKTTLTQLATLVQEKELSKRWDLETRLALIQVDDAMSGKEKRDRLVVIESEADDYPTVQSRVRLIEGETYLQEAKVNVRDQEKAQRLRDQARAIFEEIIAEFKAEPETLAGAYSGLGDCLYESGANSQDADMVQQAVRQYLRVVTVYEAQSRYVPRAYFEAARCFKYLNDRSRQFDMRRALERLFPDSQWVEETAKL